MNALNKIKGNNMLEYTQGSHDYNLPMANQQCPRKQRDNSLLLLNNQHSNSNNLTHDTDMYFDKNIEEKLQVEEHLRSIIDDTESE